MNESDLESSPPEKKGANLADTLKMLHAGTFIEKCDRALTEVVQACNDTERDGKFVIEIAIKPTGKAGGASDQVELVHVLKYTKPTTRGKRSEEDTTKTPLHVGFGGKLTEYPERQQELPGMERAKSR